MLWSPCFTSHVGFGFKNWTFVNSGGGGGGSGESIVPAVRGLGREVNFSSNNQKVKKIDGLST